MPEIKERPILLSAPMVRAVLEGRKTVTRRALKMPHGFWETSAAGELVPIPANCPHGKPGDRLWVRESHAQVFEGDIPQGRYTGPIGTMGSPARPDWKSRYVYRADGDMPNVQWHHVGDSQPVRWTPSIHMPRAACRILLEITDVRVERLQDITYEQAAAEGVHRGPLREWCASDEGGACHKYPVPAFRDLWQSVGGNWDANPWVWVVEFKRVTP
ncbi:hypothetical protein HBO11_03715 [Pseudomonas sp. WS 5010]|uniref:hypothetical protein n=1 Tax=Pseudomonas sp. WS 5010 TaxID=2717489 RepID=UPI00147415FB|nr:hypothetical protein [Pseudomonas sp. WS 5010]NMX84661.1 hypothetical protein [Pseudomonas sp. WS 5010]